MTGLIKTATLLLVLVWQVAQAQPEQLNQLEFLTEDYPPYNYLDASGELRGIAVEMLLAATALAGSPVRREDIKLRPWARAYHETLTGPNRVLFATTRTPIREALFKWAGPISRDHAVLLARKASGIVFNGFESLMPYTFGAVRDDASEYFVRDLQLPGLKLILGNSTESMAKMLASGRIDLWACDEHGGWQILAAIGANTQDFIQVATLQPRALYFAFSHDVDERLVQQLQLALDTLSSKSQAP